MIGGILTLLKEAPLHKYDTIDIAKGKHKLPNNFKEFKNQLKWRLKSK